MHCRFTPIKKKYKPKRFEVHDVTGHVADKIIIQDFDVATPVKKVGLAHSFREKTRVTF